MTQEVRRDYLEKNDQIQMGGKALSTDSNSSGTVYRPPPRREFDRRNYDGGRDANSRASLGGSRDYVGMGNATSQNKNNVQENSRNYSNLSNSRNQPSMSLDNYYRSRNNNDRRVANNHISTKPASDNISSSDSDRTPACKIAAMKLQNEQREVRDMNEGHLSGENAEYVESNLEQETSYEFFSGNE